ncbi:MAG: lysylphosphatidylglycerol synthase domain-containing protein [bacterium]|nr:lysylphosphatidylglycerol synthase domain-containing protein [bacterium]
MAPNRDETGDKLKGVKPQTILRTFVVVSIAFTLVYLYRNGLFYIPGNISWGYYALGVCFALVGHILDSASWREALRAIRITTPLSVCTVGTALAIFGKYIPGKVWMIAGRTIYLRNFTRTSVVEITNLVLLVQVIMLWTGMAIGVYFAPAQALPAPLLLAARIGLTLGAMVFIFLPAVKRLMLSWFRLAERIPLIPLDVFFRVTLLSVLTWLFWSLGYVICLRSIYYNPLPFVALGAFPLAAVIGILALVVPGGIGVREGVIAAFFVGAGIPVEVAATFSVMSRLWFFTSEVLFAVLGALMHISFVKRKYLAAAV